MNVILKHSIRFVLFLLLQVLVLNQVEVGQGIQLMVYPLFVFLLPVELNVISLMLLSFFFGISIDAMSDTYGLHASSLLVFAFLRPMVFALFAPRDGYDPLTETTLFTMGTAWFLKTFGILILAHHFWYFLLEMFKWNEVLFILQKTALSAPLTLLLCLLIQYLFLQKKTER